MPTLAECSASRLGVGMGMTGEDKAGQGKGGEIEEEQDGREDVVGRQGRKERERGGG